MRRFFVPVLLAPLLLIALAVAQNTRVGPLPSADSLAINQRVGRTGETITQSAGGENKERVRRGNCYWASGVAVAPGTATGTTANFVLYNPSNSGVLAIVKRAYSMFTGGTSGGTAMFHCVNGTTTQTAPTGGTVLTTVPALGGANNASLCVARSGATVVAPSTCAPFQWFPSGLVITSVTAQVPVWDDIGDGIQLLPGTTYQMQGVGGAGTSPVVIGAVFWEENTLLNGQP